MKSLKELVSRYADPVIAEATKFSASRSLRLGEENKRTPGKFSINRQKFIEEIKVSYVLGSTMGMEEVMNYVKRHLEEVQTAEDVIAHMEMYLVSASRFLDKYTTRKFKVDVSDFHNGEFGGNELDTKEELCQ